MNDRRTDDIPTLTNADLVSALEVAGTAYTASAIYGRDDDASAWIPRMNAARVEIRRRLDLAAAAEADGPNVNDFLTLDQLTSLPTAAIVLDDEDDLWVMIDDGQAQCVGGDYQCPRAELDDEYGPVRLVSIPGGTK